MFFDGLSNAKFNSLKTDISNQALQRKDAVPRAYDKVLNLAGGWKNKSSSTHNNNSNAGVDMAQHCGPGRGDQGGTGRGRGHGGRDRRGSGPGRGRGRGGRGAQNHPHQHPSGEQAQPEAKKGPAGGCFRCLGDHYVCECPELASYQKAQLFIQTQEGGDDRNDGDDEDYDVNGE